MILSFYADRDYESTQSDYKYTYFRTVPTEAQTVEALSFYFEIQIYQQVELYIVTFEQGICCR